MPETNPAGPIAFWQAVTDPHNVENLKQLRRTTEKLITQTERRAARLEEAA